MHTKSNCSTSKTNFTALSDLVADPVVIIDWTGKLAANQGVKGAIGFDAAEFASTYVEANARGSRSFVGACAFPKFSKY